MIITKYFVKTTEHFITVENKITMIYDNLERRRFDEI
jgi:hypothetical protein